MGFDIFLPNQKYMRKCDNMKYLHIPKYTISYIFIVYNNQKTSRPYTSPFNFIYVLYYY